MSGVTTSSLSLAWSLRNWLILDYEEANGQTVRPWAPFLLLCLRAQGLTMEDSATISGFLLRLVAESRSPWSFHSLSRWSCHHSLFQHQLQHERDKRWRERKFNIAVRPFTTSPTKIGGLTELSFLCLADVCFRISLVGQTVKPTNNIIFHFLLRLVGLNLHEIKFGWSSL